MTQRRGRELEVLVGTLEKICATTSVDVRSPDYLPDRDTGQLREVDVSLRTRAGTVNVLVVLEVRDRATPQDVTWIEQLSEKLRSVQADKIIAVSATNFTEPAQAKAHARGIILRSLESITLESITDWFAASGLTVTQRFYTIKHLDFEVDAADDDVVGALTQDLGHKQRHSDRFLIRKSDGVAVSMQDLWQDIPDQSKVFEGVPTDGSRIARPILLNYPDPATRYQLQHPGALVDILRAHMIVELWQTPTTVQPTSIRAYRDLPRERPEADLAHVVEFSFTYHNRPINIKLVRDKSEGHTSVVTSSDVSLEGETDDQG